MQQNTPGVANERRQCCYRRLNVVLRREGQPTSISRIYCIYPRKGWR